MNTDEHSEKIAELLYGFIDQLTLGQYPTFYFSADVLETTPRTILARYKAYFLDPEELSTIPDGLNYEEKSAKLEWPTEEGCASLSDDCLIEWVREDLDVEENVPWDDPRISDDTIAAAMWHFDEQGEELIQEFGSAEDVRYELYPKRLEPHLRRFVEVALEAARPTRVSVHEWDDANMAGSEWSWQIWVSRRKDGTFSVGAKQITLDPPAQRIPARSRLRTGTEVLDAIQEVVEETSYSFDLDPELTEKIAANLECLSLELSKQFRDTAAMQLTSAEN